MSAAEQPPAALPLHLEWPRIVLVDCPACGALAGGSCRESDGRLRLANHSPRVAAIFEQLKRERLAARSDH